MQMIAGASKLGLKERERERDESEIWKVRY